MKRIMRAVLFVTALAAAIPAVAAETPKGALLKKSTPDIVAKVGEGVVTRRELDQAIKSFAARQGAEIPQEKMKEVEAGILDQLIAAEILYQEGRGLDLKEIDREVDFRIAQGKGKFNSMAEYEAALASSGLTESELAGLIRKDTIINKVVQTKIVPTVTVTEDDARKYYTDNQAQFKKEPEVRASHILIGVDENASPEAKKSAREKAEAILKELKEGKKDFAELARRDSTYPSREQGGDLGFFGRGQMVKPFEDAAFALKVGETSGVVETQFGYHIIRVTDRKEAETVPFNDIKDKLIDYLKNQEIQKKVAEFVTARKGKLTIETFLK